MGKYDNWCIDSSLSDKSTKIGTNDWYRVQAYQVSIVNPRWPPKIQDGRHEIQFFDISTSDGGDFPRIIEIALFFLIPSFKF